MSGPDIRAILSAAATAYQEDDFEGAEALSARACKLDSRSIDAWDFHSLACQALGSLDRAERSCRKALALVRSAAERDPLDDKLALRQILLLIRLGRDAEIAALFTELQDRHPNHAGLERLMASWRLKQR